MRDIVLSATVCHLTVNVNKYGRANITRASGRTIWEGVQRYAGAGKMRLEPGENGNGSSPEDRVRVEMLEALESALDVAWEAKVAQS